MKIHHYFLPRKFEESDRISQELERYKVIKDYYEENDDKDKILSRVESNESYLLMITERLFIDIPKEKIPKGLEVLYVNLCKFFAEKSQYI